MDIPQRLIHLISGYMRLNCNDQYFPNEIVSICINYTGITKNNQYDLIKSNTELKQEMDEMKRHWDTQFCETNDELKIALLGSEGVGKSGLMLRFVCDLFLDGSYDPTIEDEYRKLWKVDDKDFLFQILYSQCGYWDRDEQLKNQTEFIKECNLFIFVYSITSYDTFEEVKDLIIKVNKIKRGLDWYGVIAGNKVDLESYDRRAVPTVDGKKLAQQYSNLKFYETSAMQKINHWMVFEECARWYMHVVGYNVEEMNTSGCCSIL